VTDSPWAEGMMRKFDGWDKRNQFLTWIASRAPEKIVCDAAATGKD
jgi:hypothetical protein